MSSITFVNRVKNLFTAKQNAGRAIMPNFLVIGAMKAGTTSLHHYLKQHPQVYMSPKKEPRFFTMEGREIDKSDRMKQKLWEGTITNIKDYQALFKGVRGQKAIGEVSPLYLCTPKAPKRIKYYIPDAKLIAILRNPVERAYSNYLHNFMNGFEHNATFEEALEQAAIENRENYKMLGFYYIQLKRYLDLFDSRQIKIYLYEDFNAHPEKIMQNILSFIGVNDTLIPDMSVRYLITKIPKEKKPPLTEKTRKSLIEVYREDVVKLQGLIGRDLSGWLE